MQAKKTIIFSFTILVITLALFTIPAFAVEEEGNANLLIFNNAERTTLVELDSNGRYYLTPGTEYYITIQEITEYPSGQEITFWAYRVNTNENFEIAQQTVTSDSFDAEFICIFPEDWYEEPVQIKYGTNIETNCYTAQKEIWIDFIVGNGILYVYTNPERTDEAPTDEWGNYLVLSGVEYYFTLNGVTEYENTIKIWASYWNPPPFWKFTNIPIDEFTVSDNIQFSWTIPDLPMETTLRFKYGKDITGWCQNWRFAAKPTCFILPLPRKLFVVNEIILGPLGAIAALFIGYTVKSTYTKSKQRPN